MKKIQIKKIYTTKNHGLGNFQPLYEILYDDDYCYFFEDLVGFDLKSLLKLCGKKLDLLSVVIIGIYLIINLQILHNNGYVHRDIKPDNLTSTLEILKYYIKKMVLEIFQMEKKFFWKQVLFIKQCFTIKGCLVPNVRGIGGPTFPMGPPSSTNLDEISYKLNKIRKI